MAYAYKEKNVKDEDESGTIKVSHFRGKKDEKRERKRRGKMVSCSHPQPSQKTGVPKIPLHLYADETNRGEIPTFSDPPPPTHTQGKADGGDSQQQKLCVFFPAPTCQSLVTSSCRSPKLNQYSLHVLD